MDLFGGRKSSKSLYDEMRRRRVLRVRDTTRPLFVAQVSYKAGRFSWPRPCLLVVTATAVLVLDVQTQEELEARGDGGHAAIQLAVRASEIVDVVQVPGGLRLEYKAPGALRVSPAVFGFAPAAAAGGPADDTAAAAAQLQRSPSPPLRGAGAAAAASPEPASHRLSVGGSGASTPAGEGARSSAGGGPLAVAIPFAASEAAVPAAAAAPAGVGSPLTGSQQEGVASPTPSTGSVLSPDSRRRWATTEGRRWRRDGTATPSPRRVGGAAAASASAAAAAAGSPAAATAALDAAPTGSVRAPSPGRVAAVARAINTGSPPPAAANGAAPATPVKSPLTGTAAAAAAHASPGPASVAATPTPPARAASRSSAGLAAAVAAAAGSPAASSPAAAGSAAAEELHQITSAVLIFEDPETALAAAGAILYAQSVDSDASRWVSSGLPTGFAIDLACAMFDQSNGGQTAAAVGPLAAAAAGGEAAKVELGPGPWGAAVKLPPRWCAVLSDAASGALAPPLASPAAGGARGPSRAASLTYQAIDLISAGAPNSPGPAAAAAASPPPCGAGGNSAHAAPPAPPGGFLSPRAAELRAAVAAAAPPGELAVYFSTPLGMAVAGVRLEHLVALQRDGALDTVLAVPINGGSGGCGAAGGRFSSGGSGGARSGGGASSGGSSGGGSAAAAAAGEEPCFRHRVVASLPQKGADGPGSPVKRATNGGGSAWPSSAAGGGPAAATLSLADRGGGRGSSAGGGALARLSTASLGGASSVGGGGQVEYAQTVYAVLHISLSRQPAPPAEAKPAAAAPPAALAALKQEQESVTKAEDEPAAAAPAVVVVTPEAPRRGWLEFVAAFVCTYLLVLLALLIQSLLVARQTTWLGAAQAQLGALFRQAAATTAAAGNAAAAAAPGAAAWAPLLERAAVAARSGELAAALRRAVEEGVALVDSEALRNAAAAWGELRAGGDAAAAASAAAAVARAAGAAALDWEPLPQAAVIALLVTAALEAARSISSWRRGRAAAKRAAAATAAATAAAVASAAARQAPARKAAVGPRPPPLDIPAAPVALDNAVVTGDVWSVTLLGASLVTQPDAYVQAQIKQHKAAADAAAAAAAAAAAGAEQGAAAAAKEEGAVVAKRKGLASALPTVHARAVASSGGGSAAAAGGPVLVADPEPSWMTPDIRQRFLQGKPTLRSAQDQARLTHAWRQRLGVNTILERPPGPWYEFVSSSFRVSLVSVTDDGCPVLLIKLCDMKRLGDGIRTGAGSLRDLEEHLAFMNEYMYKVAAPCALPGGMAVQIIDCTGARLSHVTPDTIAAFRVFAVMGLYYPERMNRAVVINAPGWFEVPWRIAYAILDENTRSKVTLEFDQRRVEAVLEEVLGPENVPTEYGGPCTTPPEEAPEMKKLAAFVAELRAGRNPYEKIAAATPQP